MTARALFDAALAAARDWHRALPEVTAFCDWPDDLEYRERPAHVLPMLAHLQSDPGAATDQSRALRDALVAVAPHAEWRLTYTEDEVGRDFLDRFGWFELAGPDGHFLTHQVRMTIGFWGAHLDYDWHQHQPEELYSVVSGSALFHLEGAPDLVLGPGATRFHPSETRHALFTQDAPILTFVHWRGEGLADNPRMSA